MFPHIMLLMVAGLMSMPLLAKDKPTLTVYSYSSFLSDWGPGQKIAADFEAQCDCYVNIVSIGDGVAILNRLRLEGSKTKADVILGLDTNLIATAKKADLVQPHQLTQPTNLAIDWWDSQFVPYDHGYFAFIYNQEKITTPPASFADLLNNDQHWKIVYQDPRTSTPGLGLLLWVNKVYGANAIDAWHKIADHTLTVTKGWSESYSLFLNGEADFVLSYSTSPAVHIMNDNDHRYQAAIFTEGHYQQIEVVAITKQTKQLELAQQFIAFLLTPEAQQQFMTKNIMYPVIDIAQPAAFQQLKPVNKGLSFTADQVYTKQKEWIKQWQDAVSQ